MDGFAVSRGHPGTLPVGHRIAAGAGAARSTRRGDGDRDRGRHDGADAVVPSSMLSNRNLWRCCSGSPGDHLRPLAWPCCRPLSSRPAACQPRQLGAWLQPASPTCLRVGAGYRARDRQRAPRPREPLGPGRSTSRRVAQVRALLRRREVERPDVRTIRPTAALVCGLSTTLLVTSGGVSVGRPVRGGRVRKSRRSSGASR